MADLLGSILDSMDKPPSVGTKEKKIIKQQKEELEKRQAKERTRIKKFREEVEEQINTFIQDSSQHKYKFQTMTKVDRSIVHDVADVAGLTAFSFGEDEVDRYVMIFKKEFAPSDEELLAYRRGEEWDPKKMKELKEYARTDKEEGDKNMQETAPKSNYKDKYSNLLGKEAGKEAARITTPNKQFGFVPSENKRDQRSIEQTLADLRAKKKQKTEDSCE